MSSRRHFREEAKKRFYQVGPWLTARRNGSRMGIDAAAWVVGLTVPTYLRLDLDVERINWPRLCLLLAIVVLLQLGLGLATGLYRGRFRTATFDEVVGLTWVWLAGAAVVGLANVVLRYNPIPSTAAIAGVFATLAVMFGSRMVWRSMLEYVSRPLPEGRKRVLVFGAGDAGQSIVRAMLRNPDSPYVPVGLLDDDRGKRYRSISGVRVCGSRDNLEGAAKALQADVLLIAIPSASASLVGELFDLGTEAGLAVYVLPPAHELAGGVTLGDIRPLQEADLLGREEVEVQLDDIIGYVTTRRVLVTGAGGSIGSELCRQLYQLAPAELVMVDHDESALHGLQLSIEGRALLDSPYLVVADIRDAERMDEVFARWRPEVVFHAAALKHLSLLEQHPGEAAKTNVLGTRNVLAAAIAHGVERFVNVSTDKAADPTSVLGATKKLAEDLTAAAAEQSGRRFVSVRFGNVLGSRGSVLPTFREQIARGGPVTVTDPDATRYFMTIPEAVRLVLQAGAIGRPGETMILDMGEPVRILDLARRLISHLDPSVKIVVTGLRPGEKLHEALMSGNEVAVAREHPRILHTHPAPPPAVLDLGAAAHGEPNPVTAVLAGFGGWASGLFDFGLAGRPKGPRW
jgi:FlaA1/EpsC-like NDP-sugar epimerase